MRKELLVLAAVLAQGAYAPPEANASDRPNILWITVEDMSPDLGAWGDAYARTPHIDRLAEQSVRYTNAFATAPVCSPSRSTLITGIYATSLGTQRLRSQFPIPDAVSGFPTRLREAGYYTSNNAKTDYNTGAADRLIAESWNESSEEAHWRGRREGQPFFAVFNDLTTHQSRSMSWSYEEFQEKVQSRLEPGQIHDPAQALVPPYYPDTPLVRRTVARYYDCITAMDENVGRILAELAKDGLAGSTIVFFFSDHGAGLPRHKRVLQDSGLKVPLLIRFPDRYRHLAPAAPGESLDRLVSFVDFPPTLLSLLGLDIPPHMHGVPFLGAAQGEPRRFVYGARDRIDEAYDLARAVRSRDHLYIRNYMSHLSYNQPSAYSDQAEIRQEIGRLAAAGALTGPALAYAGPTRSREELYAVGEDPQQLHNLAGSPEHQATLLRLRGELDRWLVETRDVGFLPEPEAWVRARQGPLYALARSAEGLPLERIVQAAALVGDPTARDRQRALLGDGDTAVRYWAAVGLGAAENLPDDAREALEKTLSDPADAVRIAAAAALSGHGDTEALDVLAAALELEDLDAALLACRSIELLGERARALVPAMSAAASHSAEGQGDRHMFIRFSSGAFLERLGP